MRNAMIAHHSEKDNYVHSDHVAKFKPTPTGNCMKAE